MTKKQRREQKLGNVMREMAGGTTFQRNPSYKLKDRMRVWLARISKACRTT